MKPDVKTIMDVYSSTKMYRASTMLTALNDIEKLVNYQKDSDFYKLVGVFYKIYNESLKGIYKLNIPSSRGPVTAPSPLSLTGLARLSLKGHSFVIPKYFQFLASDLLNFFSGPIKNFKTSKVQRENFPIQDLLDRKEESIKKINWISYKPIFNNIKIYFSQAKKDFQEDNPTIQHVKKFEPGIREEDLIVLPSNIEFALLLSKLTPSDIVNIAAILLISWERCPNINE